jgi:hypothetical protein
MPNPIIDSLKVIGITPNSGANDVSIYTNIELSFNGEIDKSTVLNNFTVLKDIHNSYVDKTSLNSKDFAVINGAINCSNFNITFTPDEVLEKETRYLVCCKRGGLHDIYGNALDRDYIFTFSTYSKLRTEKPVIINPTNNSIVRGLTEIKWQHKKNDGYILQISNEKDFNYIIFEKTSDDTIDNITIDKTLDDNTYYIRIRTLSSEWSDAVQIYLQNHENLPMNSEDLIDNDIFEIFNEQNYDIQKITPSIASSIKLTVSYMVLEFNGNIVEQIQDMSITRIKDFMAKVGDGGEFNGDADVYELVTEDYCTYYDSTKDTTYVIVYLKQN